MSIGRPIHWLATIFFCSGWLLECIDLKYLTFLMLLLSTCIFFSKNGGFCYFVAGLISISLSDLLFRELAGGCGFWQCDTRILWLVLVQSHIYHFGVPLELCHKGVWAGLGGRVWAGGFGRFGGFALGYFTDFVWVLLGFDSNFDSGFDSNLYHLQF